MKYLFVLCLVGNALAAPAAFPDEYAKPLNSAPDEGNRRGGRPIYRYVVHKSNFVRKTQINGTNFQVILESDRPVPMWDIFASPAPVPEPEPSTLEVGPRKAGHQWFGNPPEDPEESIGLTIPTANRDPSPSTSLVSDPIGEDTHSATEKASSEEEVADAAEHGYGSVENSARPEEESAFTAKESTGFPVEQETRSPGYSSYHAEEGDASPAVERTTGFSEQKETTGEKEIVSTEGREVESAEEKGTSTVGEEASVSAEESGSASLEEQGSGSTEDHGDSSSEEQGDSSGPAVSTESVRRNTDPEGGGDESAVGSTDSTEKPSGSAEQTNSSDGQSHDPVRGDVVVSDESNYTSAESDSAEQEVETGEVDAEVVDEGINGLVTDSDPNEGGL